MTDTPKTAPTKPDDTIQPTVIEIIAQEEQQDKKFGRIAVVLAAILHVAIFAVTWPSFAGAARDAQQTKAKIYIGANDTGFDRSGSSAISRADLPEGAASNTVRPSIIEAAYSVRWCRFWQGCRSVWWPASSAAGWTESAWRWWMSSWPSPASSS